MEQPPQGYSLRDMQMKAEVVAELRSEMWHLRRLSLDLAARIRKLEQRLEADADDAEALRREAGWVEAGWPPIKWDEDDKGSD